MAAAIVSIGAPARATPTMWTRDPRALKLLASCAKNPPAGDYVHTRYVTSQDCHYSYTGYRAEALDAIRDEYARTAMQAAQAGDADAWSSFQRQPTVTAAIDAAPLALIYAQAATELRDVLMAQAVACFTPMAEAA
jgi:hypothetical protein